MRQKTHVVNDVERCDVVTEREVRHVNLLLDVQILLRREDVLVELMLQSLVGVIDAELLKRVRLQKKSVSAQWPRLC